MKQQIRLWAVRLAGMLLIIGYIALVRFSVRGEPVMISALWLILAPLAYLVRSVQSEPAQAPLFCAECGAHQERR